MPKKEYTTCNFQIFKFYKNFSTTINFSMNEKKNDSPLFKNYLRNIEN